MLIALILVCAAVLSVSFLCSLVEAVLLSLNPLALRLKQTEGDTASTRWLALKNNIERPVSALLVFNALANTGLATLSGALFTRAFGSEWLWLFSVVITTAVLFGGELAPKIIGIHHAERLAPKLLTPILLMMRLCRPLVWIMERFCERLKRTSSNASTSGSGHIMDIITLVQAARAEHALHNREEIIIIHAATLSARRVKSVMVPHGAVKSFSAHFTLEQNVSQFAPKLHRSYPVSEDGSLNAPSGYIRVRELFMQNLLVSGRDWKELVRPVLRVSEFTTLTELLALFLEKNEIAALVENGEGTITGWVTLDDVTETLMGTRG